MKENARQSAMCLRDSNPDPAAHGFGVFRLISFRGRSRKLVTAVVLAFSGMFALPVTADDRKRMYSLANRRPEPVVTNDTTRRRV